MSDDYLSAEDIAVVRALGGDADAVTLLRTHVEETGGQHRPQQEEMTAAVQEAISSERPLLVQAGTGTGKSLAYSFAIAATGAQAVIATATNQLSEQLIRHDLPQVAETLRATGQDVSVAMLKGRAQYLCLARLAELRRLDEQAIAAGAVPDDDDALFTLDPDDAPTSAKARKTDAAQIAKVTTWADKTKTGDRSEAPPVSDRVWSQVSVSPADCAGAACPFVTECFSEKARKIARAADIVVTNHALVAQDIRAAVIASENGEAPASMFGKHTVLVIDEAHDFPDALTSALSREVNPAEIGKLIGKAERHVDTDVLVKAREALNFTIQQLDALPAGPVVDMPSTATTALSGLGSVLLTVSRELGKASTETAGSRPKAATAAALLSQQFSDVYASIVFAGTARAGMVRWVDRSRKDNVPVLRSAPLEVGEALSFGLENRTFIGTSATLTVAGDFTTLQRVLALQHAQTLDVGSPFDYPSQGMLYVPGRSFPEPVGRDRVEHTAAVLRELETLVTAAGGRTLALFTTTNGARNAAEHLRGTHPHLNILSHGDAPADQLVQQFRDDETSVLCATMGLWQGVDAPGATCSLVVVDKVGFAPVDDVLSAARRKEADEHGRDGFTEVIVAQAAVSLAQAAGRLIRRSDDKGVVAILDPRLRSKGYGRTLLKSLPPFRVYDDVDVVAAALTRLTGGTTEEMRAAAPTRSASGAAPKKKSAPRRAGTTRKTGLQRRKSG